MRSDVPTVQDCAGLHDPARQGYSHLAFIPAGARTCLISGQYASGASPDVISPRFDEQIAKAFDNLKVAIHEAKATSRHVAKLTIYIVDHSEDKLPLLGEQLVKLLGDHRPAMTVVPVPKLAMESILFEIEATVVLPTA